MYLNLFPKPIELTISSELSLDAAVLQIEKRLVSSVWKTPLKEGFVGEITESVVCISRYRPGNRRMLSPRFTGILLSNGAETLLKGKFEMTLFEKTSCVLFLSGALLASLQQGSFIINGQGNTDHILKLVGLLSLMPSLLIIIRVGWYIRRDDIEAIDKMLNEALNSSEHKKKIP